MLTHLNARESKNFPVGWYELLLGKTTKKK